jgi:hypothetical protein
MLADAKNTEFSTDWKQTMMGGIKSLGENKYNAVLLDLGLPDSPQHSATFTRVQAIAPAGIQQGEPAGKRLLPGVQSHSEIT